MLIPTPEDPFSRPACQWFNHSYMLCLAVSLFQLLGPPPQALPCCWEEASTLACAKASDCALCKPIGSALDSQVRPVTAMFAAPPASLSSFEIRENLQATTGKVSLLTIFDSRGASRRLLGYIRSRS